MFITAEYRRGLIRTTLIASPRRGRVLAAKAIVIGSVAFAAGLVAAAGAVIFGTQLARGRVYVFPVSWLTELRMVVGTAALVAVAAVLALAVGSMLRRSAAAVTVVIVVIVLPYLLGVVSVLPAGAADWVLRITPAAAFAVQQAIPQYPQVTALYSPGGPGGGYFPLAPWAGFAVLCGWAAARRWPWPWSSCAGGTHEPVRSGAARGVDQARTIASTGWLLLAAIALTVAVGAAAAAGTSCPSGGVCQVDPAKVSLTGIDLGQAVVAVLAVLAISNEYSTGMIRITLSAMPRRTVVLAAKAAVLGLLVLAAGTIAVLASVLAGRLDPVRPRIHSGPRL